MHAFRAIGMAALSVPLALAATPAHAQVADDVVVNILRECSRIDDPSARLACYDNNIRAAGGVARTSVPGEMGAVQGGRGAAPATGGASGFGRESITSPDRFDTPAGEIEELSARVTEVEQIGTGLYRVTLEDGAVWQFSSSVPFAYRPPRPGRTVTIDRGALGSFLLTYDRQDSVRVERVR